MLKNVKDCKTLSIVFPKSYFYLYMRQTKDGEEEKYWR